MPPDPIIFHHLQKTGGSSIRMIMFQLYGKLYGFKCLRHADGTWKALPPPQLAAQAWLGHMSFGLHRLLQHLPKPVPYFTVVRDPVTREISRYLAFGPDNKRIYNSIKPDWGMVYQLSGAAINEVHNLSQQHIDVALNNLKKHYLYVGDTSRFGELGLWLRDGLSWPITLPLPHENPRTRKDTITEDDMDRVREHPSVKLDQLFYDEVRQRSPYPHEW